MERDILTFDVVIVGGGPSGLSTAIRLMQLAQEKNRDLSVCLLEKGAEIGSHILSGAIMDPKALDELLPEWRLESQNAFDQLPVDKERFSFLTAGKTVDLPVQSKVSNQGLNIISLGELCRWLAKVAEGLGVDIFPGFSASKFSFDEHDRVQGVITQDQGRDRQGNPKANFQPGVEIQAKVTVLAEGCRGSLTKKAIQGFQLDQSCRAQTHALGIKEIWEIDPEKSDPGLVCHSIGYPLSQDLYGGSFLYHLLDNRIAVGLVTGLDYSNPWLSPFQEFQRLKIHPGLIDLFSNAKRVGYGARTLSEGGFHSIPKLTFPGGLLVGDCAGFMNSARLKGIHGAIKSGIEAATAIIEDWDSDQNEFQGYSDRLRNCWLFNELEGVRNIRAGFKNGLWMGLLYSAMDLFLFKGNHPISLNLGADHRKLNHKSRCQPIRYQEPDRNITFDRLSSLELSNIRHREDQPCHILLKNDNVVSSNHSSFANPETRYCPAQVFEIENINKLELRINSSNCLHCKCCDIKDPLQAIEWSVPEGGSGPNYWMM
ncbi:4Fe-4S dicluster domain-containing protein [Magnetococcales bacterium HHB-1]